MGFDKMVFSFVVLFVFVVSTFSVGAGNGHGKSRFLVHDAAELSAALDTGCRLVRDAKTVKAVACSESAAASLGLEEDIQVFAVKVSSADTNVNKQIGADLVHVAGNTGVGRKIVVIDTGYNYNHLELSSSYLGGKDFVNNDDDPLDDNGHGSHVAGLITSDGVNANAKGVAPDAGILAAKVLDAGGSGFFSDVVAAIYWAVDGPDGIANTTDDFNADALSLSLGTGAPYLYKGFCDSVFPDLTNAINYARGRNVLVVVAAGNSGNAGVSLPGCISKSTTIGAVDGRDRVASFSGRGKALDVTAPGVALLSAWLGADYKTASGTSMATPVVSAVAALIKFAHPEFTDDQLESRMVSTAKDLGKAGFDTSYGWGRVNANNAVN